MTELNSNVLQMKLADRHRVYGIEADNDFTESLIAHLDGTEADDLGDDARYRLTFGEDGQAALLFVS